MAAYIEHDLHWPSFGVGPVIVESMQEHLCRHDGGRDDCPRCQLYLVASSLKYFEASSVRHRFFVLFSSLSLIIPKSRNRSNHANLQDPRVSWAGSQAARPQASDSPHHRNQERLWQGKKSGFDSHNVWHHDWCLGKMICVGASSGSLDLQFSHQIIQSSFHSAIVIRAGNDVSMLVFSNRFTRYSVEGKPANTKWNASDACDALHWVSRAPAACDGIEPSLVYTCDQGEDACVKHVLLLVGSLRGSSHDEAPLEG